MEPSDSEEDSEIEKLLAQLEEERLLELGRADNIQGPLSQDLEQRYEKLKAQSFGSHVNTKLDTLENSSSTLETEKSKGPSSPRIGKQEAGDVAHANEVHLVDKESLSGNGLANASKVAHGDAAKKASFSIPHTSSLKLLHAQQEASDSMDPSPPVGCSCFFLSSKWGEKKQKKKPLKGEGWGSNHKDKAEQEKIEEEWASMSKNLEGVEEDQWWEAHAGIFDVKRTEMEFKRVSMKEKKLTQEAQKLIEMVASASARSASPPHYAH